MNRKNKALLKINVMSLFLIAISSISVTLAWFAYSGLSKISTEIDIKSWLIEFEKSDTSVSNNMVISLDNIYPGMDTMYESIKIKNKGDSNAKLSYSISSIRILDEEIDIKSFEQEYLKDKLSHEYPFNININLSDNFVLAKGEDSSIELSISWPLDSPNYIIDGEEIDSNKVDSDWGNLAYQFELEEERKYKNDNSYQKKPAIKINISAKAEQIIGNDEESDTNYPLGKLVLYDVLNNVKCYSVGGSCIRTHVIDINNKVGDSTVSLLPDLFNSYSSGDYLQYDDLLSSTISGWNVTVREFEISDVLNIISKDIKNSLIVRDKYSNAIIGYLNSDDRIDNIINNTILYNGYYSFLNSQFPYLVTNKCFWFKKEYNSTMGFALTKIDEDVSKIYGKEKTLNDDDLNKCSVVPVIIASK